MGHEKVLPSYKWRKNSFLFFPPLPSLGKNFPPPPPLEDVPKLLGSPKEAGTCSFPPLEGNKDRSDPPPPIGGGVLSPISLLEKLTTPLPPLRGEKEVLSLDLCHFFLYGKLLPLPNPPCPPTLVYLSQSRYALHPPLSSAPTKVQFLYSLPSNRCPHPTHNKVFPSPPNP